VISQLGPTAPVVTQFTEYDRVSPELQLKFLTELLDLKPEEIGKRREVVEIKI
jgi:hypothetical protein